MKNFKLPGGYSAGIKRSQILASLFVCCLLTSCQGLGRYQLVVGGPIDACGPYAPDIVMYRIDTRTGVVEYLIEVPILDDDPILTGENVISPQYTWYPVYIDTQWSYK